MWHLMLCSAPILFFLGSLCPVEFSGLAAKTLKQSWRRYMEGHCGFWTQSSFSLPAMVLTHLGRINAALGV